MGPSVMSAELIGRAYTTQPGCIFNVLVTGKGLGWLFAGPVDDDYLGTVSACLAGRAPVGLSVISSETRSSGFTFSCTRPSFT